MREVVLLLGGNAGSVEQTFEGVRHDLEREVGQIKRLSDTMSSEAWGFESAQFLNQALLLESNLDTVALLDATQSIEERWGRCREQEAEEKSRSGERYLARTIDIDIIFYGEAIVQSERLTIPHPLIAERRFALEPLAQIVPQWVHPASGVSVEEMLNDIKRQ